MMAQHKIILHCLLLLLVSQCAEVEVGWPHSSNSPLLADDISPTEDSDIQIHLHRLKRNVNQQGEYELDVALSIIENDMSKINELALKLLQRLSQPIHLSFESGTFNITGITLTTVCRYVNNETQCKCDSGFTWNSTFCSKYQSCSVNNTGAGSCDCIRSEPTEGIYCELPSVITTPKHSTEPTTTSPTTVSTTTTVTTTSSKQNNLKIKKHAVKISELTFTDELNNRFSSVYKNLSKEFKTLLENAYKKVQSDAVVNIIGFTKGSVIVLHQVISKKSLTLNEIIAQIQNLSPKYTIKLLPDDEIPCYNEKYGTTNYNLIAEISCGKEAGVMKRRCGKNGKYEEELDFCISNKINKILQAVNTSLETKFSNLLHQLSNDTNIVKITTPGNVQAVITILTHISNVNATVNETDMENVFHSISRVISSASIDTWKILTNTQNENNSNPSSQLLQTVENFNDRLNLQNYCFKIEKKNVQLKAARIIHGNSNCSTDELFTNISTKEYSNLSASVFISPEEFEDRPNATVITIAYPTLIDILPNTTTFDGDFLINGLVVTITLNVKKPVNISMTFSLRNRTLDLNTAMCAFWDFSGNGTWNNTGCTPEINGENIICNCEHLTSFSILMSPDSIVDPALGYITIIGVAISIGCLVITVIIEATVWKHVIRNKISYIRHIGILSIAVNLLVADIWFIVASAITPGTEACIAVTFFIHFFYLALFFWMLTLGLLLVYRLLFPFHILSKSAMMGISFSIGYLSPLVISVITIGVTYPRNSYTREGACWLGWEKEYPLLAFVIPALVIIAINLIILIVVIFKLLRPTIGDRSRENNQERETFKQVVRSIAVLTPILGLTWGFGIPTFQKGSPKAFHYVFTILNASQGFFILVFGTFMDKKVRGVLMKSLSSEVPPQTSSVRSTLTAKTSLKRNHQFHFRRKCYNLTQQLHSNDNDTSLIFYSKLSAGAQR